MARLCSTCCYWLQSAEPYPTCALRHHYTDPAKPRAKTFDDVVTLHWRAEDSCEEWTAMPEASPEWEQVVLVGT